MIEYVNMNIRERDIYIYPKNAHLSIDNVYLKISYTLRPLLWPFPASLLREGNYSLLRAVICMMCFAAVILNLSLPHLNKKGRSWLRPKCLEGSKDTPIKACSHIEGSSQTVSHFTIFSCGWMIRIWTPKHEASLTWISCDVSKPSACAGFWRIFLV